MLQEFIEGSKELSFFVFHNVLNYGLMLAVMMFNGYIFVAVAMGAFVGYFLFGHLSMKTNMENLQAIQTKIICSTRCADSGECQTLSSLSVLQLYRLEIFLLKFISFPQALHVATILVHAQATFAITISKNFLRFLFLYD